MELVGPAGAGKTELSRALSRRDKKIHISADLELRRVDHVPIFVGNVLPLLPVLLHEYPQGRWFTWDEIKAMVYLRGWTRVLQRKTSSNGRIIILDHGPVFKLAKLVAFRPERLKSKRFRNWWNEMLKKWAFALDMVIWLDASDTDLVERINARDQRHVVKGRSEREISVFLARYRTSYAQVLAKLEAYGRPALHHFDTSQATITQTVDEVLNARIYPYQ